MSNYKKFTLSLDLRLLVAVLLAIIFAMLLMWQPWNVSAEDSEVIKVTGETTLKAEPDEFTFTPRYSVTNSNKDTALQLITDKSEELVEEIIALGIDDSKIKTNVDGFQNRPLPEQQGNEDYVYNLTITVVSNSYDEAQKLQDYLATTGVEGSVTPMATFSEAKRKQLEDEARDQAVSDARRKAEQTAKNLGFKLHKVKSVEDGAGFDSVVPMIGNPEFRTMDMSANSSNIQVMPGENELKYALTVTYYLR